MIGGRPNHMLSTHGKRGKHGVSAYDSSVSQKRMRNSPIAEGGEMIKRRQHLRHARYKSLGRHTKRRNLARTDEGRHQQVELDSPGPRDITYSTDLNTMR